MRKLLLVAVALFSLTATPRADAAVITYDLTLTPTNGPVGGSGTLVFSGPFDPFFQDIPSITAPNVDLFQIIIGGQTFDLTNTFTNIRLINGVFANFGTSASQNGITFNSSDTTYTLSDILNQSIATTGQITAQLHISAAVPEPSTWAMMILGFAVIGVLAYRRTRRDGIAAPVSA